MPIIGPLTGGPGTLVVTGVNGDIYKAGTISANLTGDVIGPNTANTVVSITGENGTVPISAAGNVITWVAGATGVGLSQATATSDVPTQNMTIMAQAPYASASTNRLPGNVILSAPNTVNGGTGFGHISMQADGYTLTTYGNAGIQYGALQVSVGTSAINMGQSGMLALSSDQYCRPYLSLTGTLGLVTTVILPAIDGAQWIVDMSKVNTNNFSLKFQAGLTGSNSLTYTNTNNSVQIFWYDGPAKLLLTQSFS